MGTGVEWLMIASAAAGTVSAISQGQQAKATGKYQQEQIAADALAAQGEAELQAIEIRKAGRRQRGAAVAAQAASGVSIGSGTAELINTEIDQGAEQDALTAIFSGRNRGRQMNASGQAARISGNNQATAGYFEGANTALRAGSKLDGWRSKAPQGEGMYGYRRDY
jgi:hypothetical protein